MKTNDCHEQVFSESDLIQLVLSDNQLDEIVVDDMSWATRYQQMRRYFDLDQEISFFPETNMDPEDYYRMCRQSWFLPEEYRNFDVEQYLLDQCVDERQRQRVCDELELYRQAGMVDVLIFLHYFIRTLREKNLVWGVGRGSSVASYILYLLGVHKINSLEYDLDIGEFIRWQK